LFREEGTARDGFKALGAFIIGLGYFGFIWTMFTPHTKHFRRSLASIFAAVFACILLWIYGHEVETVRLNSEYRWLLFLLHHVIPIAINLSLWITFVLILGRRKYNGDNYLGRWRYFLCGILVGILGNVLAVLLYVLATMVMFLSKKTPQREEDKNLLQSNEDKKHPYLNQFLTCKEFIHGMMAGFFLSIRGILWMIFRSEVVTMMGLALTMPPSVYYLCKFFGKMDISQWIHVSGFRAGIVSFLIIGIHLGLNYMKMEQPSSYEIFVLIQWLMQLVCLGTLMVKRLTIVPLVVGICFMFMPFMDGSIIYFYVDQLFGYILTTQGMILYLRRMDKVAPKKEEEKMTDLTNTWEEIQDK
jgi:Ca2+/Na+ antiporter